MVVMTESVEIRPAQDADLDRVALLWHVSAGAADDAPLQTPSIPELRERIDAELADAWTLHVAWIEGELIGMLAVKKTERVLDQLYILPSFQRRGAGKALLNFAMEEMPAGFTLRTGLANYRARSFYEHMGLNFVSEGIHPRSGHPVCFYGWSAG